LRFWQATLLIKFAPEPYRAANLLNFERVGGDSQYTTLLPRDLRGSAPSPIWGRFTPWRVNIQIKGVFGRFETASGARLCRVCLKGLKPFLVAVN
jgi:hypothetical protein